MRTRPPCAAAAPVRRDLRPALALRARARALEHALSGTSGRRVPRGWPRRGLLAGGPRLPRGRPLHPSRGGAGGRAAILATLGSRAEAGQAPAARPAWGAGPAAGGDTSRPAQGELAGHPRGGPRAPAGSTSTDPTAPAARAGPRGDPRARPGGPPALAHVLLLAATAGGDAMGNAPVHVRARGPRGAGAGRATVRAAAGRAGRGARGSLGSPSQDRMVKAQAWPCPRGLGAAPWGTTPSPWGSASPNPLGSPRGKPRATPATGPTDRPGGPGGHPDQGTGRATAPHRSGRPSAHRAPQRPPTTPEGRDQAPGGAAMARRRPGHGRRGRGPRETLVHLTSGASRSGRRLALIGPGTAPGPRRRRCMARRPAIARGTCGRGPAGRGVPSSADRFHGLLEGGAEGRSLLEGPAPGGRGGAT